MSDMRDLWYDWLGVNTWLFKKINSISGISIYDSLMKFVTIFGDKKLLPYMLTAITVFAIVSYIVNIITKKSSGTNYLFTWFNIYLVIGAGLAANHFTIDYLKNHFSYPRPYVALPAGEVKQLEFRPADDSNRSFPSGHVAIITLLVAALWPALNENFRWGGIFLVFAVAWSRIALGVHFPMDVLSSFVISLLQVIIIRRILFTVYRIMDAIKHFILKT